MTDHTDDMVAHLAAVILDTDGDHPMERGRAVLRAMREPTQEMANAGWSAIANNMTDPQGMAWPVWRAMIDTALDAEPPVPNLPKPVKQG